jgi:hypothetical protein
MDYEEMQLWGLSDKTPEQAKKETDEAIKRVDAHAQKKWQDEAAHVIWRLARSGETFTTDEVMTTMEASENKTHDPRALGPIIRRAITKKVIHATGDYVKSTRRHSSPIPVYIGTR